MRVLILEDDTVVAMSLEDILTDAGFEIAGLASSIEGAHELLKHDHFDLAVLDVNIGFETSEVIARILKSRRIPFITLSGFTLEDVPPSCLGVVFLRKPMGPRGLVAAALEIAASLIERRKYSA